MKSAEEIKKGLECCSVDDLHCGQGCPYKDDCLEEARYKGLESDALAYIQQLESKLNQAVEDIRMLGRTGEFICPVCAHYNHGEGTSGECVKCLTGDGFRWRGEKEETSNDAQV